MFQWKPLWVNVPVVVTLNAYDALDVVGGTLTSAAITQAKGGGYINCVRLIDDAVQAEAYTLYVYKSTPSVIADAAAYTQTVADTKLCIGSIDIAVTDYNTAGSACDMAFVYGRGGSNSNQFIFFDALATPYLYFRLVAVATPDYAAVGDLTLDVQLMVL